MEPIDQPKRVALYTRVSLDRTGEAESPELHIAACRAYVEARGHLVAGEYIDRDVSGYKTKMTDRPAWQLLWSDIEAGKVDAICVQRLDRFGRQALDNINEVRRLKDAGVDFLCVTENVDTSSAMGWGVATLMFSVGQQYSETHSKNVARAWEAAAAQGKPHVGGRRLFGYTQGYEVISEEASIVREVVDRLINGESLRSVATDLNARGVLTAESKNCAGKPWSAHGLRQCLRSPALAGMRTHRGMKTAGTWEPIITPERHEALLVKIGAVGPSGDKVPVKWLLTGIVRCGGCGERMSVVHQKHYGCVKRPETNGCGKVFITQKGLDAHVVAQLLSFLAHAQAQPLPAGQDPAILRTAIEVDNQRLERLNRARFVDETIGQNEWRPAREELVNRIHAAKDALTVLESRSALRPGTREELDAWWEGASIEERRAAVRDAFDEIVISPATRRGSVFDTDRVRIEWNALEGLEAVAEIEVTGTSVGTVAGTVYVIPAERLNR